MDHQEPVMTDRFIGDIAELKAQYAELGRRVDEGNRNTQLAIHELGGRMQAIAEIAQQLARLAAQHDTHSRDLGRAFDDIESLADRLDDHVDAENKWKTEHEKDNGSVERKMAMWQGLAFGISLTIGIAGSVALYAGSLMFDAVKSRVDRNESRIIQLEGKK